MTVLRSYFRTIIVTLSLMGSTLAVSARSSALAIGHVSSVSTIQQPSSAKSAKSAATTVSQTSSSTNTQSETQTSNSVNPPTLLQPNKHNRHKPQRLKERNRNQVQKGQPTHPQKVPPIKRALLLKHRLQQQQHPKIALRTLHPHKVPQQRNQQPQMSTNRPART